MKLLSANIKCIAIICSERMNEHIQVFVNERETQKNKIDITYFFLFCSSVFLFHLSHIIIYQHIQLSIRMRDRLLELCQVRNAWHCKKRVMCHFEGMLKSQGNVESSDRSVACTQIVVFFVCPFMGLFETSIESLFSVLL